jgi:CheY-like chemotaxis protein
MAARALGPDIKITTNLDPSVPPVLVDSMSLENALLNLAVNARDAMPQGGSLMISTRLSNLEESYPPVQAEELKPGRYARIAVSDTGHGMSPETLERAFEPFFTTKPRGKGTGLGLAMVYGFARRSGGTVRIYSEPGRGTTVSLYLPLAAGMPVPAPVAAASSPQARAVGTVLVVDDEVDLLEIAVAYLEDMGYRALHATDGAHALEVLAREPGIDLLITDVMMPGGMNGVELARKVRELKPDVKIIYSSGFPSEALAERSGTQVDGPLLYKPYQRNEFATAIRRVMDGDNTILHGDPAAQT